MTPKDESHTWNHRVVSTKDGMDIREVYYKDGVPDHWMTRPVGVYGDTVEELRETLNRMLRCLEKPVLDIEQLERSLDQQS